jgi:hypothetical protein
MKKTITMILLLVVLVTVLVVTEVMASPIQPSMDGKSKKTPGAQATENALKKAGNEVQETQEVEELAGKKVNYKGIVVSVDSAQLVITLKDESLVTFLLNDASIIKVPKNNPKKRLEKEVTVPVIDQPLEAGMRVGVKAFLMEDGSLVAQKINVVPGKPEKAYHVGIVTEYTPEVSITIHTKKCELSTYLLTEKTKYLPEDRKVDLKVGSRVTVISPRDVTGGELTAAGVVIHPEKTVDDDLSTDEPTVEPLCEPVVVPTPAP